MTGQASYEVPVGQLQELLAESKNITDFLNATARLMTDRMGKTMGKLHGTMSLTQSGRVVSLAQSDPDARSLDELQRWFPDSPYWEVVRTGEMIFVADTRADPHWGDCGATLAAAGVMSIMVGSIMLDDETQLVATTYFRERLDHDPLHHPEFPTFVARAVEILNLALRMSHLQDTQTDLKNALSSRTVVDLAAGIVMGQKRCTQEQALESLRAAAKTHGVRMRDVAARLVLKTGSAPVTTHFKD